MILTAEQQKKADDIRKSVYSVMKSRGFGGELSDGYMGSMRWDGSKSRRGLYGGELTKALRDDIRDALAEMGVKRSCVNVRTSTYSMGQHVYVTVKMTRAAGLISHDEYMAIHEPGYDLRNDWITVNGREVSTNTAEYRAIPWEQRIEIIRDNVQSDWERLNGEKKTSFDDLHTEYNPGIFTDWAQAVMWAVCAILYAYNHDDSNSMVDYFDRDFYQSVEVQWID